LGIAEPVIGFHFEVLKFSCFNTIFQKNRESLPEAGSLKIVRFSGVETSQEAGDF
jgi:hypothetical protein